MNPAADERIALRYNELVPHFAHWEKTKDLIDQCIDVVLNYRQSGHPGGSRSKVHLFLATLLGGTSRWDIRHPEKRFGDRFVLVAGHTVPLVYCTLAVLNEAMRLKFQQTGDKRYAIPHPEERMLTWEDLLKFRRNKGLGGHAEMEGKTLFLKFNTGPSGHGAPAAAGEALALKRAGAKGVKVFAIDGEGGLTPGATHETMNSAYGLALDNLYYLVDWNDFGIDDHAVSVTVYGSPTDWFAPHGWRVYSAEFGSEWGPVMQALLGMSDGANPNHVPSVAWFKTRKGRGYGKYDNASHGTPHKTGSEIFWETKKAFAEKYGAKFVNVGGAVPGTTEALAAEFEANLKAVMDVLRKDQGLVDYLADRLVALGDSVPDDYADLKIAKKGNPYADERLYDYRNYPADMWVKPGIVAPNRAGLSTWGAWMNAFGAKEYGRPLMIAASADLADSTAISGFAKPYGDFKGWGWYVRHGTEDGVLLPQEITEFTNAGIMVGLATVNFSRQPEKEFEGFWGACSTYGSFSYLKYGMFRLFSQLAQDCELKVGKVLWIAGHSGPETAEDSRTHFGIFAPGVTQLFPDGHIINLHPWEHNEVPVLLAAAFKTDIPIVALHLTRPPVKVPDRVKLGMPSHFEAARGAYIVRDYKPGQPKGGTIIAQGASAVANLVELLPELEAKKLNVKIVCTVSTQLFRMQPESYRNSVISAGDRIDSTVVTTQARWLMHDWIFNPVAEEYAMSADWDNQWRTGGSVPEVMDEAHLSTKWLLDGITRFVRDRDARLGRVQADLEAARGA